MKRKETKMPKRAAIHHAAAQAIAREILLLESCTKSELARLDSLYHAHMLLAQAGTYGKDFHLKVARRRIRIAAKSTPTPTAKEDGK